MTIESHIHTYEWFEGDLYLKTESGYSIVALTVAAENLSSNALTCLSSKKAWRVSLVDTSVILSVKNDKDADWCEQEMKNYILGTCIKWGPDSDGGSMHFKEKN